MLEKRKHERRRTEKTAALLWNSGQTSTDCRVVNVSDTGACIRVLNTMGIPDEVYLTVDEGTMRRCRVAWRTAHRLGVSYD
jgi:PilZ domain